MLSRRKFGLEVEHISELSHAELADVLAQNRVVVDHYCTGHSYCPENCFSGWQVKTDGSISDTEDYPEGIELASPPLTLKRSSEVHKALNIAQRHGIVNQSCGLHVHVEARELVAARSNSYMRQLIESNWQAVERAFFSYMPPSRRTSSYCKAGIVWDDKYMALNLSALRTQKRTIEFRLHSPTLNARKALSFAALCVHYVDYLVDLVNHYMPNYTTSTPMEIDPGLVENVSPKLIKTRGGKEFWLQRQNKKWFVESALASFEASDLTHAMDAANKLLKLRASDPLRLFQYPRHGNAMSKLCDLVKLEGPLAGFLEARYEAITAKYGIMHGRSRSAMNMEDEDDFFHEELYEDNAVSGS